MLNRSGLYLHIPFCVKKCAYCDFYSLPISTELIDRYTDALCGEIKKWGGLYDRPFDTVYFGGGTPSLLGSRIIRIMDTVRGCFDLCEDSEITAEMNPVTASSDFLDAAKTAGVNRLSIGVQSGDDRELSVLGRLHTSKDVVKTVETARSMGFENISLDLMLNLPDSDNDTLKKSLDFLIGLNPEHISAYMLKLEEGTPLSKRRDLSFPDDDAAAEQYQYMCSYLEGGGYEHYEISNFARDKKYSRHNLKYWRLVDYLGIGPSAHSFIDGKRFFYPRDIGTFIASPDTVPDGDGGDIYERIMLALRISEGFDFSNYTNTHGFLNKLCENGLGKLKNGIFSLTDKGMAVSNTIITEILEIIE